MNDVRHVDKGLTPDERILRSARPAPDAGDPELFILPPTPRPEHYDPQAHSTRTGLLWLCDILFALFLLAVSAISSAAHIFCRAGASNCTNTSEAIHRVLRVGWLVAIVIAFLLILSSLLRHHRRRKLLDDAAKAL